MVLTPDEPIYFCKCGQSFTKTTTHLRRDETIHFVKEPTCEVCIKKKARRRLAKVDKILKHRRTQVALLTTAATRKRIRRVRGSW